MLANPTDHASHIGYARGVRLLAGATQHRYRVVAGIHPLSLAGKFQDQQECEYKAANSKGSQEALPSFLRIRRSAGMGFSARSQYCTESSSDLVIAPPAPIPPPAPYSPRTAFVRA